MTFCRVSVLALLFLILSGPYLRLIQEANQKPVLAVVIDESASMTLPAGPFTPEEAPAHRRGRRIYFRPSRDARRRGSGHCGSGDAQTCDSDSRGDSGGGGGCGGAWAVSRDRQEAQRRDPLATHGRRNQARSGHAVQTPGRTLRHQGLPRRPPGPRLFARRAAADVAAQRASDVDDTDLAAGVARAHRRRRQPGRWPAS